MNRDTSKTREFLVDALSQSSMLQYLGKEAPHNPELREMLHSGEVLEFEVGETIITEGDASDRMYVLAVGCVEISVGGNEICTMAEPGELFGEFGALTGELRTATVRARVPVTCLALNTAFLNRNAGNRHSLLGQLIQRALNKILLGRLKNTSAELATAQQAIERLEKQAAFLRVDNETLNEQLDRANEKLRDGLRGTRAGETG